MSIEKYLDAYATQRHRAKSRGIEFKLTFKEWCDFWGDDIERRGSGPNDLQMQRIGDSGPYAIGNIKKGTPSQNAKTMGLVRRSRNTALAREIHEAELDYLMTQESGEEKWLDDDAHELAKLGYKTSLHARYDFVADK